MKKSVLAFCTSLLLLTQAAVVNAEEVRAESKVNDFQSVAEYRLKINAAWSKIQWTVKNKEAKQVKEAAEQPKQQVAKETTHTASKETMPEIKQEEAKVTAPETKQEQPKATTENVTKAEPAKQETVTTESEIDVIEQQVVELTNKERAKHGLAALQIDKPLMAAAREKSQDMKTHNYFSHTSPTFGSPFDRLKSLGISYKAAGENIAKGQTSAAQVVEAWMNSEGHRANILNAEFTHIGVGYVKSGHIWTQQFIKK